MKFTTSLFSQILQITPRVSFSQMVRQFGAERHAKGFSSWSQYVSMIFCQLAQAKSLREISDGLAVTCGKLSHLGLNDAPAKSTLAYANAHRPWQLYQQVFFYLRDFCRRESPGKKRKFRFKNKLLSLDATTIDLCLSLFPWAEFRRAKGGVKAHVLLDHEDYMPSYVLLSKAKMHDAKVLALLRLNAGSIVAMDRAYNDYKQFARWTQAGVYFVTRMKDNAVYEVVQTHDVPLHRNILADESILLTGAQAQKKCPHKLRRIVVWDADNEREIILLTNHLDFGATTIADIYKERWQIELFFKALKQNLKIRLCSKST